MNPFSKPLLRFFFMWMFGAVLAFAALVKLAQRDHALDQTSGGLLIQFVTFIPLIWFLLSHLFQELDIRPFFMSKIQGVQPKELLLIWSILWIFIYGLEGIQILLINWISPELVPDLLEGPIYLYDHTMIINVLNIILAVILGPVMEELVFRGLILQRLMVKFTAIKSLLVSSVLFGLLHLESWLSAAIFGLVMGMIFIKTRNLWVPILLHVANNAMVVLVNVWHFRNGDLWTIEEVKSRWLFYVLGLVMIPFLIYLLKKYWPKSNVELPYVLNLEDAS